MTAATVLRGEVARAVEVPKFRTIHTPVTERKEVIIDLEGGKTGALGIRRAGKPFGFRVCSGELLGKKKNSKVSPTQVWEEPAGTSVSRLGRRGGCGAPTSTEPGFRPSRWRRSEMSPFPIRMLLLCLRNRELTAIKLTVNLRRPECVCVYVCECVSGPPMVVLLK